MFEPDRKEVAAREFYETLFRLSPDLRTLFPDEMSEQSRKFAATLVVTINSLSDWEAFRPVIEALARRHVSYGVQAEHYELVKRALAATLKSVSATPEEMSIWMKVYQILADHMVSTAYPEDRGAKNAVR